MTITDQARWLAWSDFIRRFHHATTKQDEFFRPTIIALVGCAGFTIADDVALRNRNWRPVWTDSDSLAQAEANLLQRTIPRTLFDLVAINSVAKLAIWDEELCKALGKRPAEVISNPIGILQEYASFKNWTMNSDVSTAAGTAGYLNGDEVTHSALLALASGEGSKAKSYANELIRRRWHAQATVLLPWIEEKRLELIIEADRFLPKGNSLDEVMEIGALAFHLSTTNAPSQLKRKAHQLRLVRNDIAHLRLQSVATLRGIEHLCA